MKKILLKIPLFFLFLFVGNSLFATHIMGGEITWECLNSGQYVFTVKIYRDCNGIAFNVNNIAIEAHNYPNAGNITFIPVNFFSVTDITPSCEGSPCATLRRSDPDIPGAIEEYVLRSAPTTLNGVPPATGWAFTWTSGNRNVAIDNINNASNFGITLRALMFPYFGRNANLCFDSSPDFYQKPSTIICAGERFTYNHSAFDSDLDSLSYEWARPLEGNLCATSPCQIGGVFVTGVNPPEIPFDATRGFRFDDPYPDTLLNPLNEAAILDSETGEITFTSYTEGEYVSVIKVTAYKCGAKVAEVYRELQTVIASGCAANEPPIISTLANNSYRDTVKVGDTVRFRITILDSIRADNPNVDSIFVFGSGQQFGANFTNPNAGCLNPPCAILTAPLPDTGVGRYTTDFYWETTCDHIQNTTPICFATANSYQFIVRAFDDFCPAAGQTIATYTITILADSLINNPDINCANVSASGDVTIDWDDIHDPDKTFSAYLIYVADFRNGPYTLLDSLFDSTLTSYTHIGAGANNNSKHYIVQVRSGCQAGWTILPTDTISTIYIDPILNDTCVSLNWTGLDTPLPNNSDTNYLIYREYPVGSGFVLYDSTSSLSYCDTFDLCTDTVTYRIQLGNNGDCPGSSSNTQGIRYKYPDPSFTLTAQPNVSCNGLTDANAVATVTGGIAPFTYLWSTGSIIDTIKDIGAGMYSVTITDVKGCIASDTITITQPDVLSASIGASTNVSCNGGNDGSASISVTGGTTPYSYSWPSGDTTANDSGLTQGTYIVTITDFNNCSSTISIPITEPSLLTSTISASNNVSCNGGANGTATVTPSGGTAPYTFAWPSGTLTAAETGLSQGTYVVTVTDFNNCTSTSSVAITEPTILTSAIGTSTNVSCNGGSNGTGSVNASGGTPPYSYAWPSGDTTVMDTGLTQGTYIVTVTDFNNCTSASTVIITEPNLLTSTISASINVSCNGNSDGMATVTPSGGTIPYTYAWPSGTPTATETGLSQGTYVVTVSDFNNCTTTSSVTITEPTILTSAIGSSTNVSCNGGSDGTATVTPSGGTTPYSYSWPSGDTTATDTGLTQGTYLVTVTDFNNCTSTSTVIITEPNLLTSTISASAAVSCNGGANGSATVTASGGTTPYRYAWPSGTPTANETGLSQGIYVVTVTDFNNCTSTSSVTITEPNALTSAIGTSTNVSCNGGSDGTATVTPTGGTTPYSYSWPSGDTTAIDSGLTQGTYIVTVTDFNNCTSTSTIIITEPNILTSTISASNNISCNGNSDGTATVTPSGGTIPYSYAWPSGDTTATDSGLTQGTYIVTVTDFNNCTSTSSVTITEPTILTSSIGTSTNVSCNGGSNGTASINVTGGTSPYSYAWPSGDTTATDTGLSQGTYIVTVTDFNNCISTSSVVITEPSILISTISASTAVSCNGGVDGTATVTASGGTVPYTYSWPSGTPTANETGLSQGTYVATVTDFNNCISTSSVSITQPDSLKMTAENTRVSCFGLSDGQLIATPIGGTAPYGFYWSDNSTDSINSGLTVGSYRVTITDANGCSVDSTFIMDQPDIINLLVSPYDTICIGNTTNIQAIATGGNSSFTFNWNNNLPNSNTHQVSPNTQTTYTVSVTDDKGCSTNQGSIIITIRDLSKDNLQAISSGNICIGESTNLSATHDGVLGGYGYTWSNNVGNGLGPISVSPTITTQYIVNAFDVCGAIISDSVEVIVENYPLVSLPSIIKEGCEPLTVNFIDTLNSVPNNLTYTWTLGDGSTSNSNDFNYTYDSDGTYPITLKISTPVGCESSSSNQSQVIVYPSPVANFTINPNAADLNNSIVTFTNTSTNTNNVEWDFYDSFTSIKNDTIIQFNDTGWFPIKLVAYSRFGCKDSIFKNLRVNPVYELVIPNAFTPNRGGGNGGFYDKNNLNNDVFYIHTDLILSYEMQIFNRWGELIFLSKDVNRGWDGYYLGKLSPQDVYVYKVSVVFINGKRETKTGNFTLFR